MHQIKIVFFYVLQKSLKQESTALHFEEGFTTEGNLLLGQNNFSLRKSLPADHSSPCQWQIRKVQWFIFFLNELCNLENYTYMHYTQNTTLVS